MWRGVTDQQWENIVKHLPIRKKNRKGGRRPADDRKVFEGILWVLWTGAPWGEIPRNGRYASPSTCWRRLKRWEEDGTLEELWRGFLAQLNEQDHIRWDECFADGTFASAKRGGRKSARPREERVRSLWFWLMARVLRSEFPWRRRRLRK